MIDFKKMVDENSNKSNMLINLLQVWDHNHYIMICDYNTYLEYTNNTDDIGCIMKLNFPKGDSSFKSSTPKIAKSLAYLNDLIEVTNLIAVIECDPRGDSLFRGYIYYNEENNILEINTNTLYEEYRPKTTSEKYNRILSDYTIYLKEFFNNKQLKRQ